MARTLMRLPIFFCLEKLENLVLWEVSSSYWPGHQYLHFTNNGPRELNKIVNHSTDLNRERIGGRFINQDEPFGSPREKINKPTLQLILTWKENACE